MSIYWIGAVLMACLGFGIVTYITETIDYDDLEEKFFRYVGGLILVGVISAFWMFLLLPALTAVIVKAVVNRKKKNS